MIKPKKPLPQAVRTPPRPTFTSVVRDGGLLFRSADPMPMLSLLRKPN